MTCSTDLAVWHGSHDGRIADALLDHLGRRTTVLADKACDTDPIRELIQDRGANPNIPQEQPAPESPLQQAARPRAPPDRAQGIVMPTSETGHP
jgi:hypothetical protein